MDSVTALAVLPREVRSGRVDARVREAMTHGLYDMETNGAQHGVCCRLGSAVRQLNESNVFVQSRRIHIRAAAII